MPLLRRAFPAWLSRLILRRTTLDPFLDESGPSARRLGELSLDGRAYDALETSLITDLSIEIRTVAPSTLRVPCAAPGPGAPAVTFEVAVAAAGERDTRRVLQVADKDIARWHTISVPVPEGRPVITLRARALDAAPASRAVWGVPSLTWRKSAPDMIRSVVFAVRAYGLAGAARRLRGKLDANSADQYAAWFARHAPTPETLAAQRAGGAAALPVRPLFAWFIDEGRDATADLKERLAATVASLDNQTYTHWELWLRADQAAQLPGGAGRDRVQTLGAAAPDHASARNAMVAGSSADFVGTVTAGDRLAPEALFRLAERLSVEPDADVLYSDEDDWSPQEGHRHPRFKPDWSPEYLRSCMYLGRLLVMRRALVSGVGGYRDRFAGALDYDLALRVTPAARRIEHVPEVLYHRHQNAPAYPEGAHDDAAAALADAYARDGLQATVVAGARPGVWRPRITMVESLRIAVVIPTDGQPARGGGPPLVVECVRNVLQRTRYPHVDLLVCDNGNLSADARAFLDTVPHRRVTYRWDGAFNFPRKINFAVAQTDAPYVLLLNDDVEPINAGWLEAMLEYAHQRQIGAVGAKLFYPDGRLQHVGVAVGVSGVAAHLLHQQPGGTQGCGGIAVTARNCSAVTGACLLTRRRVYDEVGGFDERLALDFNDVDFCLRVRAAGYRIVFTPHARLFHHESASFGVRRQRPEEVAAMRQKWGPALERDPYYNVNLSREFADCRLALAREG